MTASRLDTEIPFASAFSSIVASASRRLDVPDGLLSDRAVGDLERGLTLRLGLLAGPALLELYRSRGQRYRPFVGELHERELAPAFDEYPVLEELVSLVCAQWVVGSNLLLTHLAADVELLGATIAARRSAVERVVPDLGDPHRGGRTVHQVVLATGTSWAYKPRPTLGERQFFDLLGWFRGEIGDSLPVPCVVDAGDHGWMEFVRPAPCRSPADYWRRAGEIAALLFLAGAEDLHHENLIATGEQLVPVDLECIEQPLKRASATVLAERSIHTTDSVRATGLLPGIHREGGPVAREVSGLLSRPGATTGTWTKRWAELGSDAIHRTEVPSPAATADNSPFDEAGRPVGVDTDALVAGFAQALDLGSRPGTPFDDWERVASRVIVRETVAYARRLVAATQADALRSRSRHEAALSDLAELPERTVEQLGPHHRTLVETEISALRDLDIPLFRAHGTQLDLDGRTPPVTCLAEPGRERRERRRLRCRGAGARIQVELVKLAAEQFARNQLTVAEGAAPPRSHAPDRTDIAGGTAIETAIDMIADGIVEEAVETGSGLGWLEVDRSTPLQGVMGLPDLYRGSSGIAVFLAAASVVRDRPDLADAARAALPDVSTDELTAPWWESGCSGDAYARLVVADLLGDPALADEAGSILAMPDLEPLDPGDPTVALDVMGGWGGVLAVHLAALERGRAEVRGPAVAICDRLVEATSARLAEPLHRRRVHRLGFAHGTTGLSYVLLRAGRCLEHPEAVRLGGQLADVEDGRIEGRGGLPGWRPARGRPPVHSWCWGVAGYVLARSAPALEGRRPHLAGAVERLAGADRERCHLCCGEAGQLLALTASRRAGHAAASQPAERLAGALAADVARGTLAPFYASCSFDAPSLFWGRAGVGYALCHAARPAIPNVLMVE